jgi:hypothetical protein
MVVWSRLRPKPIRFAIFRGGLAGCPPTIVPCRLFLLRHPVPSAELRRQPSRASTNLASPRPAARSLAPSQYIGSALRVDRKIGVQAACADCQHDPRSVQPTCAAISAPACVAGHLRGLSFRTARFAGHLRGLQTNCAACSEPARLADHLRMLQPTCAAAVSSRVEEI